MSRHRLDLLPLLDVFMVVLFVFATIQEQRLDDTTRGRAELERRVEQVQQALDDSRAREQQQQAQQRSERLASAKAHEAELTEAKRESDRLRRDLGDARQALVAQHEKTQADLARAGVPQDALDRIEVLSRVLDKYSVFELEIIGDEFADGSVRNRCCYRADPLADDWRPCGDVPPLPEAREQWLDGGAGGLSDELRRTKGGNAMTLIRSDQRAGYRIGSRLVEQLRERYTDQHFYAEEAPVLPDHCGGGGLDTGEIE